MLSECRTLLQPALSPPSEGRRSFNACASLARLPLGLSFAGLRLGVAWLRYWSIVGSLANFLSIAIFTSLYNHFAKRLNDWVRRHSRSRRLPSVDIFANRID